MNEKTSQNSDLPTILTRDEHNISLGDISESALKVIKKLQQANYEAYLVGGAVRDLLLGRIPKDFDISTNALPEEVNGLFKNSRLIGRRFRLVHVRYGREIIEVATFRGEHDTECVDESHDAKVVNGMIIRDNVYGTLKEDAWRRDFTVNALYFDIHKDTVLDYTGGYFDLKKRTIRMIGDAQRRYQEDPVRMLRVVRFAAKLGFEIESESEIPLIEYGRRLTAVPPARLFEEVLKLFLSGHALKTFYLLRKYGLFEHLFPLTDADLDSQDSFFYQFLVNGFRHTDARIELGKPVTPTYLFAVLLWQPVWDHTHRLSSKGMSLIQSIQIASIHTLSRQTGNVSLPKRFSLQTREIWTLQVKLPYRGGRRALRLFAQARFRAAYDFLLLRAESGETELAPLCQWWTEYQEKDESQRQKMVAEISPPPRKRNRQRKRSRTQT